jgi:hypothetical protein
MSAEQIVDLMRANFSSFKTLEITQAVHLPDPTDQEADIVLEQKVILKSPDFFHAELIGPFAELTAAEVGWRGDMAFRPLLMANNRRRIISLLSHMGINLESIALTRFEGSIAYRVGEKGTEDPSLVIEKERFLPLVLSYMLPGDPEQKMVRVQFVDYRQVGKGWYPFEIVYAVEVEKIEHHMILNIQANVPINEVLLKMPEQSIHTYSPSLSESPVQEQGSPAVRGQTSSLESSDAGKETSEEELREIIRVLKEKYH